MKMIHQTIRDSFNLLNLPDDWDGEGAKKVNEKAFNKAILFLIQLMERVGDDIPTPVINNDKIGGIEIDIINSKADGYIRFSGNGMFAYLCNFREGKTFPTTEEEIISWIEKYML